MRKLRMQIKRFLKNQLSKDIIPLDDNGRSTELHCYKFLGTYIKVTQFIKPIEANDEQCEYLGIV